MEYLNKKKHFLIVPLFFLFYIFVFHYLEKRTGVQLHIIHTKLDRYIPFCEYFIIPYFLWFFYISIGVIYFGLFHKYLDEYYKLILSLGIGMTLFLIVSFFYPNGQNLRPYYFARDNIFVDMVRLLYQTDTSTNVLPSIHVFNSVSMAIALATSRTFRKKTWLIRGSNTLAILIVLSTVLLKQHTLLDVAAALVLNYICYRAIYGSNYITNMQIFPEIHS